MRERRDNVQPIAHRARVGRINEISERQREGIAAARARGAYAGRRPARTSDQAREPRERAAAGEPESVLAEQFGVSRETVYSYLRAVPAAG